MVENFTRTSTKVIVDTSVFLSEMISESMDSPPTSPSLENKKSNSKTRDCLKVAQSNNNKPAKRAENYHQAPAHNNIDSNISNNNNINNNINNIGTTKKEKSKDEKKSHDKKETERTIKSSAHRKKQTDDAELLRGSNDESKVTTKEVSPKRTNDKRKNTIEERLRGKKTEKRRFEEIVIDKVTVHAFKTWEDLQDELNEQISAHQSINQLDQIVLDDHHGSTSQESTGQLHQQELLSVNEQRTRIPVVDDYVDKQEGGSCNIQMIKEEQTQPNQVLLHDGQRHEHRKKRHRERSQRAPVVRESTLIKYDARIDEQEARRNLCQQPASEWIPERYLFTKGVQPIDGLPIHIVRDANLPPHPLRVTQPISGQNSHRLNSSMLTAHSRRDFEDALSAQPGHQSFVPPLPHAPLPGQPTVGNNFNHNHPHYQNPTAFPLFGTPSPTQTNAANQYLHQYFDATNLYSQQSRESQQHHPAAAYGLPPTNHSYMPPSHNPMLASSSLAIPYTSPYTITDTIISRQTIIPPSMGLANQLVAASRYNHFPPSAFDHGSATATLLKQSTTTTTNYVPSPTERSFMEFARSYASANNISSLVNQPTPGVGMSATGSGAAPNPAFDRFGVDQRASAAIAASSAYGALHYGADPASRFGIANYHNGVRSAINAAAASFYPPHFFR